MTEEESEEMLPSFDPYLMLQQNQTNQEDFFQQDIQYTSAIDKKKSEVTINYKMELIAIISFCVVLFIALCGIVFGILIQ